MTSGSIYLPGAHVIGRGIHRPGANQIGGSSSIRGKAGGTQYVQAVASGGLPLASRSSGFTGGIMHQSLSKHFFGPSDVSWLQIGDTDLTGSSFAASGFNATIEKWINIPGAPTPFVKLAYSGSGVGALNSGTVLQFTDKLLPSAFGLAKFTKNSAFYVYDQKTWSAASASFPFNSIGSAASTNFSGQQYNPSGSYVPITTSASLGFHFLQAPLVIIGAPVTPHISVFGHGDSLIQSYNPDNGDSLLDNGPGGWFMRGLASVNSNQIPWTNLGIDGNSASTIVGSSTALALITALAPYFTHFICDFGHNSDLNATNEMARLTTIWNTVKNAPGSKIRRIEHCAIMPDTNATFSITSITSVGTLCTATAPGAAFLTNGTNVVVSGATGADASLYNGNRPISNVTVAGASSTFQYTTSGTPTGAATGTLVGNDLWQSAGTPSGNQTPKGGFEPTGSSFKDLMNAALASAVGGGLLNAVLTHSSIEPVLGFWKSNGSNYGYTSSGPQPDGTHPNTNGHQLMGPEFNTRAATWT